MTDDGVRVLDATDEAWLLARERGEPGPAPSPEVRLAYDRLERALAALPLEAGSEPGWQDRILAEVDASGARVMAAGSMPIPIRSRRLTRWLVMAAPALAAAAAVVLWVGRDRAAPVAAPSGDDLVVSVTPGAGAHRGGAPASVGDVLEVRAAAAAELRIYRGDQTLVVRCPGAAACRIDGAGLAASWPLAAPGRYRVIALAGATGAASGAFDADLEAAARAGVEVTLAPAVDVQ